MRIQNRTASIAFKALIVVVGGFALLRQLGLFDGEFKPRFFFYFTNLSNLVMVAYFIGAILHLARSRRGAAPTWKPQIKYAGMMSVTVTCLVAYFLLDGGVSGENGQFSFQLVILHFFVPIGSVLDWLLFDEKGRMSLTGPLAWTVFPLVYFIYVLFMVNILGIPMNGFGEGRYPYPFIDIDINGLQAVMTTALFLLVAFVVLGYAYVAVDRLLARFGNKKTQSA